MSDLANERLEELRAGLALGDLSPEEEVELRELEGGELRPDATYEWIAATLTVEGTKPSEVLPAGLAERVRDGARDFEKPEGVAPGKVVVLDWLRNPVVAWAACAAILVTSLMFREGRGDGLVPMDRQVTNLEREAPDLQRVAFAGQAGFDDVDGEVLWSTRLQKGFMVLKGVPVNDPMVRQYQLWIIDPERDPDAPVDGGVFDVTRTGEVIIPIDAKLKVLEPAAFAITAEKPGGVVKSKQEVVLAVAVVAT